MSMELVERVYKLSSQFPKEEIYGLTSQIRRASVSIPSNIAEGSARNSNTIFIYFFRVYSRSRNTIAQRLNYVQAIE